MTQIARRQSPSIATILVVEHDGALQRFLKALLQDSGYQTLLTETGDQAIERLSHETPDLVLLDRHLPDGDGYMLCRRIRGFLARDVPIVMLGASRDPRGALAAFHAGADDYLRTPCAGTELLAQLRAHIHARPRADA